MKKLTQAQFFRTICDKTGLTQGDAKNYYDAIVSTVQEQLGSSGPGVVILPNLMKITVVDKPATKARPGRNPFTGEEMMFKAKPARKAVKVLALKGLKDMV